MRVREACRRGIMGPKTHSPSPCPTYIPLGGGHGEVRPPPNLSHLQ